jgi:hypothetical protein
LKIQGGLLVILSKALLRREGSGRAARSGASSAPQQSRVWLASLANLHHYQNPVWLMFGGHSRIAHRHSGQASFAPREAKLRSRGNPRGRIFCNLCSAAQAIPLDLMVYTIPRGSNPPKLPAFQGIRPEPISYNQEDEERFCSIHISDCFISLRRMVMSSSVPFRIAIVSAILAVAAIPIARALESGSPTAASDSAPENIVVGFVGGFVTYHNPHHGVVQTAQRMRQILPAGTYVRVFENRHRKMAYSAIFHLLDKNHDGTLSPQEKSQARIVLFGQSWGAAAAVSLARDLQREGVPVLMTVQVDSVAKLWQNDSVIPANVDQAINFYQPHGLVHGRRRIVAADPNRTEILGNYLVDYRKHPVHCSAASWFDRLVTPSHMQSECDPHLWSEVETLIQQRLVQQRLMPQDTSAQTFFDISTFDSQR